MTPDEIKSLRKHLGLNTKKFGDMVGVSSRTVENWEQGRREPNGSAIKIMEGLRK